MSTDWERQEKAVAKRRGGQRTPGSGSGWRLTNDVRERHVLWEMKSTGSTQIMLKNQDLESLRRNAILAGRMPALSIQIGNGRRWVIITEDDFDDAFPA